jgi:hypothetical protein
MIPYLTRLLDITVNNGSIPDDWKKATAIPVHKGGDRSIIPNYRSVILTSVTCKQMEHAIATYLRKVWNKEGWLYEGQHGFRPGYLGDSQVIAVSGHSGLDGQWGQD